MGILWGQRPTVKFSPIEFPYDALIENFETKAKLLWRYELTATGWVEEAYIKFQRTKHIR